MQTRRVFNNKENVWINVNASDTTAISVMQDKYKLSDEILAYSLDKNERARVEYDPDLNNLLVVFNVPHREKTNNHYETSPMAFVIKDQHLFSFSNPRTQYVVNTMEKLLKQNPNQNAKKLLFNTLFMVSNAYFPLIEEVNSQRVGLNQRLREKTTNKNLLELSDLEIGLVYLVTASRQNAILMEQIKAQSVYKQFTDDEKELVDDAAIEAKQVVEMTQLASQVLDQLAGTYNNLLNNNLNDTMKLLTIWSLLLTVPTIVTGFFGMNVPLPFEHSEIGWIITVVISIGLSIWMIMVLWRRIK